MEIKLCFVFCLCLSVAASAKPPLTNFVTPCDAKASDLNECMVKAANKFLPILGKGIKEYGLTPMDPMKVPKMDVGQDNGPVTLKLELIDTVHTGLSGTVVESASVDLDKGIIILNTTIPHYVLEGKYIGKGKILLLPIVGDGRANFTLVNTGTDLVISGKPTKMKNDVYFKMDKIKVYFTFKKTYMSLTNLFSGNKELGESTNKFLNENSDEVMKGLKGPLQDVYSALYHGLFSRLTDSVPYNQLFMNV